MNSEKLKLGLELSLSAPLSRSIAKDPGLRAEVVKRLQSVLDEIGEEERCIHNEIIRLQRIQEDFLRGKYWR